MYIYSCIVIVHSWWWCSTWMRICVICTWFLSATITGRHTFTVFFLFSILRTYFVIDFSIRMSVQCSPTTTCSDSPTIHHHNYTFTLFYLFVFFFCSFVSLIANTFYIYSICRTVGTYLLMSVTAFSFELFDIQLLLYLRTKMCIEQIAAKIDFFFLVVFCLCFSFECISSSLHLNSN